MDWHNHAFWASMYLKTKEMINDFRKKNRIVISAAVRNDETD